MYTEADLEVLVPRKIFDWGAAYFYEEKAVGRITQAVSTYKANVRGTETYRVKLTVHADNPPEIHCNRPYEHGEVCKHGIALGLAVLGWLGPDEPTQEPAPPSVPASQLPTAQQLRQALKVVLARTSDKEKLAYLRQLLYQQPDLIQGFLNTFEFSLPLLLATPAVPPQSRITVGHYRTLVQVGEELLRTGYPPDLLPHLLRHDWRPIAEAKVPRLNKLLAEAARRQPEPTLDAVMERIETYLAAPQRGPGFYARLVDWLIALQAVPAIAGQVLLFASELWRQHGRRVGLRGTLAEAGSAPLPIDPQQAATQTKPGAAATTLKKHGRALRPRP